MNKEQLQQIQKQVLEDITANAEAFEKFLEFSSNSGLERYTLANQMLAYYQFPKLTILKTFGNKEGTSGWKKFGRNVKKGEKAIYLWRPMMGKKKDKDGKIVLDDNGKEIMEMKGFTPFAMFDVSQTEGDPLPKDEVFDEDPVWETEEECQEALQKTVGSYVPLGTCVNMVFYGLQMIEPGLKNLALLVGAHLVAEHFGLSEGLEGSRKSIIDRFKTEDDPKEKMNTLKDGKEIAWKLINKINSAQLAN